MIIKRQQLLKIILIITLLFILFFQILKTKEVFKEKTFFEAEIIKEQSKISKLKNKYLKTVNNKDNQNRTNNGIKEGTAEILAELKKINLKLIDFNSVQTELNLNLQGSFNSILKFIYFLEIEMNQYEISELKIKNSDTDLFCFLKLKNELIKNEKNLF